MPDAPTDSPSPKPAPPPPDDAALQARRFMIWALVAIVVVVAIASFGILQMSPDGDITDPVSPSAAVATSSSANPSVAATTSSPTTTTPSPPIATQPPAVATASLTPATTANAIDPTASTTSAPTQTPAGNGELDGTIVDAVRASGTVSQSPDFAGDTSIVALLDNLPTGVSAGLVQRFASGDEFTYVIRYYLLPDANSARDLARTEAGFPTQFEGAQTIDDRDVPGGACVTVVVLEEVVSRCYVLRGRVAAIVEILGPAAARDHILDAGVTLAGYTREILVRAIDD